MAIEADNYKQEITTHSLKELIQLTKWQKEMLGDWSTIIGGWAVWAYYQDGFGSRDIDIVLPKAQAEQLRIIQEYFPKNGIEARYRDVFHTDLYYSKIINRDDEIIFDLFYPNQLRLDTQNLGVTVDWNWTFKFCKEYPIDDGIFINIPDPELLLPIKIVAAISRMKAVEERGDTDYRRSKIWKDYYDIAVLSKYVNFNETDLEMHMNDIGINVKLRNTFLDGYISRSSILDLVGISEPEISEKIPKIKQS